MIQIVNILYTIDFYRCHECDIFSNKSQYLLRSHSERNISEWKRRNGFTGTYYVLLSSTVYEISSQFESP